MGIDLEVKVLWELDRGDPSEPQGDALRVLLKEAGSETCGATSSNRIRGAADQGERVTDREALAIKDQAA
jgi:hypothetical protein